MKFSKAYTQMRNGKKITLPEWSGYWAWENNTIMIHCSNDIVLDIRETDDVSYTFGFICREDWIVL